MKIQASFDHPQLILNLNLFILLNTKEDILKNMDNQTVDWPH